MTYLDANATAPLCEAARKAWLDAVDQFPGNPSSLHRIGSRADAVMERAREDLATMLKCHADQIIWTSGATESANLVFHHLSAVIDPERQILVSALEHPCVVASARRYFGSRLQFIPCTPHGVVDLAWVEKVLEQKNSGLVASMAANNETGVLQPWLTLQQLCQAKGVAFVCDATQWIGRNSGAGLGGCDYLLGSAHKMGGPKGIGFLKIPGPGFTNPLQVGGPQESGRRAGTENLPGILSFVAALADREARIAAEEWRALSGHREAFERALLEVLPDAEIVGCSTNRLWNTSMVILPELADCQQRWVVKLDRLGFAVSTGSACSSGQEKTSSVLQAMGISPDRASRALRISSSWENSGEEWRQLLQAMVQISRAG